MLTPTDGQDGLVVVRDEFPAPYHRPTPKQEEFWAACNEDGIDEILFDGAIRSGKTQAACKMIVSWAWNYGGPNWKFIIMRKTYRELEDSTKAAFLRGDGKMPPACPPELVMRFSGKDEMVILRNGAEILFRSAENANEAEEKVRNTTIAGFFIDQVEELYGNPYERLYDTLISRCSDPRGPGKALLVANPGPEDHWVYYRFVDEHRREPQTKRIHVVLTDNHWNLPERYVERMRKTRETKPSFYRRFILGEWGAFGGKRFANWNPEIHVVEPFDIPSGWEIIQGIDFGWKNPTAAVWCAIDFEGRWWVVAEHFQKERPISWHAKQMLQTEKRLGTTPSSRWLDPATWARRSEFESPAMEFADWGIECGRAQNDRLGGWNRLDEMLVQRMDDDRPQLQVFSTCKNLIREIPSLMVKEDSDDVDKDRGNDHASDALRYAIMSRMPSPIEEPVEEELDPRDRYAREMIARAFAREEETV